MNKAEKTALISAVATSLLSAGLITAAAVFNSISMLAGGIITLARALTSLMMFAGIRLSRRHPDDFPTGLYKLENLVATFVGVIIIIGAYTLAKYSIHAIISDGTLIEVDRPLITLVSLLIPMTVGFYMAWYKTQVSRRENSPALKADARFSLVDAVGLGIIALGVSLEAAGVPDMDEWAAVLVAILVAWVGLKVTLDGVKVLLDASVERDVLDRVRAVVLDESRVSEVLAVRGRNSGSFRFISIEVELDTYDLREADAITEVIKENIHREVENVDQITVDFAVETGKGILCAVPLEAGGQAVSDCFEEAPDFCLVKLEPSGSVWSDREVIAKPSLEEREGRGVSLAVLLALRGVEALLLRRPLESGTASDVLDAYDVRVLVEPCLERMDEAREYLASHAAEILSGVRAG